MKPFLTLCMAMLCFSTYAQFDANRKDYSPYSIDIQKLAIQMRMLSQHEDATQITYFDLNFVDQLMQDFMRKEMNMAVVHFPKFSIENGNHVLTIKYTGQATMRTSKIQYLIFKYTYFDNKDKNPIIKSLVISGASNKVINFYVSYWPTTINFDGSHNKVAYNYLLQDKATIRLNPTNAQWSISIENTTIHTQDEYYKELDKNLTSNVKLENEYSIKQKEKNDFAIKEVENKVRLRDSLFRIANEYKIPYERTENQDDDISWLRYTIASTEKKLKSGDNYDQSNIDSLIDCFNKNKNEINNPFEGFVIFKINYKGIITNVIPTDTKTAIPKDVLEKMSAYFIGQKTDSFQFNYKPYNSYKKFDILFMPNVMNTISFREMGER